MIPLNLSTIKPDAFESDDAPADDPTAADVATFEPLGKFSICPFIIVVDVNETIPYRFTAIESETAGQRLLVSTRTKPLYTQGRRMITIDGTEYRKGLADYSIEGLEEFIQIERKSLEDLYGTLGGRRGEFEAEIARINECEFAAVIVEASWRQILHEPPRRSQLNPRSVEGTIQAWSIRYPRVHWFACDGRCGGERMAFRLLDMFWRQRMHNKKQKKEGAVTQ